MNIPEGLIDSHFHLSELEKRGEISHDICESLAEHRFAGGLNISLDFEDLVNRRALLAPYPFIHTGYGAGPWGAEGDEPIERILCRLEEEMKQAPVDAVGEIGLDYYWNYGTPSRQEELFTGQIDLASRLAKPVIIHSRESDEEMKKVLRTHRFPHSGIIHCFSSDIEFARTALEAGLYISFAGPVTYRQNNTLREVAAFVPADRILCETDAPYLAPQKKRGKTNFPLYVSYVYEEIARVRRIGMEELIETVGSNFSALFR